MPEKLKEWKIHPHFWLTDKNNFSPDGGYDEIEIYENFDDAPCLGGCVNDIKTACLMAEIPNMHNLLIDLSGADEASFSNLQREARYILKRIYSCERLMDYILSPMDYFSTDIRSDSSKPWNGDRLNAASWD